MVVEGVNISWGDDVKQMIDMYGSVVLDHFKSLFGQRFQVNFKGAAC